jgi:hypothetical protein
VSDSSPDVAPNQGNEPRAESLFRKPVHTAVGTIETDFPEDAICGFDDCGHAHKDHSYAYNCGHCERCDCDGEFDLGAWHYFTPISGPFGGSKSAEADAYSRAMRGES